MFRPGLVGEAYPVGGEVAVEGQLYDERLPVLGAGIQQLAEVVARVGYLRRVDAQAAEPRLRLYEQHAAPARDIRVPARVGLERRGIGVAEREPLRLAHEVRPGLLGDLHPRGGVQGLGYPGAGYGLVGAEASVLEPNPAVLPGAVELSALPPCALAEVVGLDGIPEGQGIARVQMAREEGALQQVDEFGEGHRLVRAEEIAVVYEHVILVIAREHAVAVEIRGGARRLGLGVDVGEAQGIGRVLVLRVYHFEDEARGLAARQYPVAERAYGLRGPAQGLGAYFGQGRGRVDAQVVEKPDGAHGALGGLLALPLLQRQVIAAYAALVHIDVLLARRDGIVRRVLVGVIIPPGIEEVPPPGGDNGGDEAAVLPLVAVDVVEGIRLVLGHEAGDAAAYADIGRGLVGYLEREAELLAAEGVALGLGARDEVHPRRGAGLGRGGGGRRRRGRNFRRLRRGLYPAGGEKGEGEYERDNAFHAWLLSCVLSQWGRLSPSPLYHGFNLV